MIMKGASVKVAFLSFFSQLTKGTLQKLLTDFFPLRGGGYPPFPLRFFGHNDFPLREGSTPQFR